MKVIAYIYTDFEEKFGIPRQSGLVEGLKGRIIFEPEYRSLEAVRGLEEFDYLWLLWQFQGVDEDYWSPMVKPPRLGGKVRMGVFATRSPFRPNAIGLSSVKLERIENSEEGPVLFVSGIDLRNRTPIYDIKPYLAYTDAHPKAREGFAREGKKHALLVEFPEELLGLFPREKQEALLEVLRQDPRPAYHDDESRRYGVAFAGYDVRFRVRENILTVFEVVPYIPA
ncbi:MAG: tRNA (N6-threonylcarbamoyladenosine(37)-N6)-methyltransferase TrmO [Lachnospiraceae bacterium]|jgi:tRNA-Thr(GGU) m(6)t(6)A37 methyltransferase TsaA|nr:tRNA (N6-threonylcarbamoyladenosine(37)-N6)-methyltransferase TrmO [Lachnospiraceae bacterium]